MAPLFISVHALGKPPSCAIKNSNHLSFLVLSARSLIDRERKLDSPYVSVPSADAYGRTDIAGEYGIKFRNSNNVRNTMD